MVRILFSKILFITGKTEVPSLMITGLPGCPDLQVAVSLDGKVVIDLKTGLFLN